MRLGAGFLAVRNFGYNDLKYIAKIGIRFVNTLNVIQG